MAASRRLTRLQNAATGADGCHIAPFAAVRHDLITAAGCIAVTWAPRRPWPCRPGKARAS